MHSFVECFSRSAYRKRCVVPLSAFLFLHPLTVLDHLNQQVLRLHHLVYSLLDCFTGPDLLLPCVEPLLERKGIGEVDEGRPLVVSRRS